MKRMNKKKNLLKYRRICQIPNLTKEKCAQYIIGSNNNKNKSLINNH